jgi:RNA-binding protein YhbY
MRRGPLKFQIGKNGVNDGLIGSLNIAFKKYKSLRISVLKGAVRDRVKVKEMAEELAGKLEGNFTIRIIGFTIILKKIGKKPKS